MNQNQSQREWTFVTASEPAQFQEPSAQRLIRSRAKRNWLHSQRSQPRLNPRSIAPLHRPTSETTRPQTSGYKSTRSVALFHLVPLGWPEEQEPKAHSAQDRASNVHNIAQIHHGASPASTSASFVPDWVLRTHVWRAEDAMAAFNLPREHHAYYSDVVNHYLEVIVPVWIPFDENGPSNFVDNHIKACMRSRLVLECLAAHSFSHQDCLRRRLLGHRAKIHRGEAVRLINESLNTGAVEDATIMGVAQMCITSATLTADSIQNRPEHLREVEIHMNGLETMVKLRGGIYNLGMNGALNEIICWLDRIVAELTSKPPRFTPPPGTIPTPLVDIPEYALDLTSPIPWSIFMLAPQATEPNRSILGILSQLARLTRLQAELDQNRDIAKWPSLEERLVSMEEHLVMYIARALSTGCLSRVDLMREASCISGSIYTKIQFRDARPGNAELQLLKNRLVFILTSLDTDTIAPHRLEAEGPFLLWILFLCGILCMSSDERASFANRIAGLMSQLRIETWEEVDGILKGYLWTGKLRTWTCLMLWQEVETARYRVFLQQEGNGDW